MYNMLSLVIYHVMLNMRATLAVNHFKRSVDNTNSFRVQEHLNQRKALLFITVPTIKGAIQEKIFVTNKEKL